MGSRTDHPYLDMPQGTILCLRGAAEQIHYLLTKNQEKATPANIAFYAGAMSARLLQAPLSLELSKEVSAAIRMAMMYANTQDYAMRGEVAAAMARVVSLAPDRMLANLYAKNSDHYELMMDYFSEHAVKEKGHCTCSICQDVHEVLKGKRLHESENKKE